MQIETFGFIIIMIVLVVLILGAFLGCNRSEGNACRICGRVLRAPRTQLNRLCHKHEDEYARYAAGIIPWKYWKIIKEDGKIESKEYYDVLEELKELGFEPKIYVKNEKRPQYDFDVE